MSIKPFVPEPGYCRCRHRVKLNADGSNPCRCCAGMWPDDVPFDPDDLDEPTDQHAQPGPERLADYDDWVERLDLSIAQVEASLPEQAAGHQQQPTTARGEE